MRDMATLATFARTKRLPSSRGYKIVTSGRSLNSSESWARVWIDTNKELVLDPYRHEDCMRYLRYNIYVIGENHIDNYLDEIITTIDP
tara:strand:- start:511 stop:774 length:264 start_codon:yes stop_codon:yes gene_type:complete